MWAYHVPVPTDLTRTVRFCLGPDGALADDAPVDNSYAAWPPMRGLGRYYELDITASGTVDPQTGYMVNIKRIDTAAREHVLPIVARFAQRGDAPLGTLLREALGAMRGRLAHPVVRVALRLTPTYTISYEERDMAHVLIRQTFDFSAAHRLHVPQLSDEENRATFGKCNNPSGHGHNYRLTVEARCPIDDAGHVANVEQLDAVVNAHVVERYDHKHLNLDTPEFAELNPSVEHIAKVFYEQLAEPIAALGLSLESVSVWETDKTVATYRT